MSGHTRATVRSSVTSAAVTRPSPPAMVLRVTLECTQERNPTNARRSAAIKPSRLRATSRNMSARTQVTCCITFYRPHAHRWYLVLPSSHWPFFHHLGSPEYFRFLSESDLCCPLKGIKRYSNQHCQISSAMPGLYLDNHKGNFN